MRNSGATGRRPSPRLTAFGTPPPRGALRPPSAAGEGSCRRQGGEGPVLRRYTPEIIRVNTLSELRHTGDTRAALLMCYPGPPRTTPGSHMAESNYVVVDGMRLH